MDDRIFPQVAAASTQQERAGYKMKCLFHERLLYRYLMRKMEGWSAEDFLNEQEIGKYALYAISDFTTLFLKDLEKNSGSHGPESICDKNAGEFCYGFMGCPVIFPNELVCSYKDEKAEKIIVMSVLHEKEIIDELLKRGILLNDIISFVSVLYS